MSEDQVALILTAISNARQESTKSIGDLAAEVAELKGNVKARLETVESDAKTAKRQHFVTTYVILPIITLAHAVAAHFGVRV